MTETFNLDLFHLLNASAHPPASILAVALLLAQWAVYLVPLALTGAWLWGKPAWRGTLLHSALTGLLALGVNQMIGLLYYHPRPFAMGVGHTFLAHAPDSSFPSDHATLIWSVGLSLLPERNLRSLAAALFILGWAVAWARIYVGVHFPLDMAGALAVALFSATLCRPLCAWLSHGALPGLQRLYHYLFAVLIRRGWVRE